MSGNPLGQIDTKRRSWAGVTVLGAVSEGWAGRPKALSAVASLKGVRARCLRCARYSPQADTQICPIRTARGPSVMCYAQDWLQLLHPPYHPRVVEEAVASAVLVPGGHPILELLVNAHVALDAHPPKTVLRSQNDADHVPVFV